MPPNTANDLHSLLVKKDACLIGPGIGRSEGTRAFFETLIEQVLPKSEKTLPTVIDADGLQLLAGLKNWPALLPPQTVFTPHAGEMAALSGLSIKAVQAERETNALHYAQTWGVTLLLKGPNSLVASPHGDLRMLPFASSALAHGGSGDVLAGLICGLLAQGVNPFDACTLAVWMHAKASQLAMARLGHPSAVLPGDLPLEFGRALKSLED